MRRIGTQDGLFSGGDPATNTKGTVVTDDWLNAVQEELVNLLSGFGITLIPADNTQIIDAVLANLAMITGSASQVFRVAQAVGGNDATPLAQVQALQLLNSLVRFDAGGTVDAITGTLDPAISAYFSGLRVSTTPLGQNTITNPTVDLCGIGPVTVKKMGSDGATVALDFGDWSSAGPALLEHDGVGWILINPIIDVPGVARVYTAAQRGAISPLIDGATIVPDFAAANNFAIMLGENRTLGNPDNLVSGQSGMIDIVQGPTGSRTLAYGWGWSWPWGTIASLSTAPLTRDQLAYYVSVYARATVEISIAAPGVVSWANHGLMGGQKIQFTTTVALPTGLVAGTTYYVKPVDANSFQVSATVGGAAITTSGSQSGVHTCTAISILAALAKGVI